MTPTATKTPFTAEVVKVTPALAREWMGRNTRNHPVRQRRVGRYAHDMREGAWQMTAEPIKFDADGILLDGQHRLAAVVLANVTVPMLVVRGVPTGAQKVMDSGVARTAGDALGLAGKAYAHELSALSRLVLRWNATGEGETRLLQRDVSTSDIVKFVEEYPLAEQAAAMAGRFKSRIQATAAVIGATWFLTANAATPEDATAFLDDLAYNATSGRGDPKAALLQRLAVLNSQKNSGRVAIDPSVYLALMLRTWNAVRKQETLTSLPSTIAIPTKIAH